MNKLHYFWIIPLIPFFIIWFIITEFLLNTTYQIVRVIVEYIKTVSEDFSILALIIALIIGPIVVSLSIILKLGLAIILSISNVYYRLRQLVTLNFNDKMIDVFLWNRPLNIAFPSEKEIYVKKYEYLSYEEIPSNDIFKKQIESLKRGSVIYFTYDRSKDNVVGIDNNNVYTGIYNEYTQETFIFNTFSKIQLYKDLRDKLIKLM